MSFEIISGDGTGNIATVGTTDKALRVQPYDSLGNVMNPLEAAAVPESAQGMIPLLLQSTDGKRALAQRAGAVGMWRPGIETTMFYDPVEPTGALGPNTNLWVTASSTFTTNYTAPGYLMNNGASLVANGYYSIVGTHGFSKYLRYPLVFTTRLAVAKRDTNTSTVEFGFSKLGVMASATTMLNQQAAFRFDRDGRLRLVLNTSNVQQNEVTYAVPRANTPVSGLYYRYTIVLEDTGARFIIEDAAGPTVLLDYFFRYGQFNPAGPGNIFQRLYPFYRVANPILAVISVVQVCITSCQVSMLDAQLNKPWAHQMAANGRSNLFLPTTGVQAANHTNSAAPTTKTIANATATEPGVGGLFAFANGANSFGGGATDYQMFTFTVPAGQQFYCTGVRIAAFNAGATSAAAVYNLQWSLAANCTAADLSTGGTYPPIRVPIGCQWLPASSVVGIAFSPDLQHSFGTPLVVESGRRLHVIVKVHTGTAQASQVIRGVCLLEGYFE